MKMHGLQSWEIRLLYDFLYVYEHRLWQKKQSNDSLNSTLMEFTDDPQNNLYLGNFNKSSTKESIKYKGYILYQQFKDQNRCYWFIRHLRDAFAHGWIKRDKKKKVVTIKLLPKTFAVEMTEEYLGHRKNPVH